MHCFAASAGVPTSASAGACTIKAARNRRSLGKCDKMHRYTPPRDATGLFVRRIIHGQDVGGYQRKRIAIISANSATQPQRTERQPVTRNRFRRRKDSFAECRGRFHRRAKRWMLSLCECIDFRRARLLADARGELAELGHWINRSMHRFFAV